MIFEEKNIQNSGENGCPKWLDLIEIGKKTYEGRLDKNFWKELNINDCFYLTDGIKRVLVRVTDKKYYKDFASAYTELGQSLVPANFTTEEVVKLYNEYFTDSDIKKYGVVAVGVEPVKN